MPGDRVAEKQPRQPRKYGELNDQDDRDVAAQQGQAASLPLPLRQGLAVGQVKPDGLGHTLAGWYRRGPRGAMYDAMRGLSFGARKPSPGWRTAAIKRTLALETAAKIPTSKTIFAPGIPACVSTN